MSVPQRPSVLLFSPYTDRIVVAAEPYHGTGSHTESGLQLRNPAGTTVLTKTGLAASDRHVVTLLTPITAGETYGVRVRYRNADGWGPYGPWYAERVPRGLSYSQADPPDAPSDAGDLPIAPGDPQEVEHVRPLYDDEVDSGQTLRRPLTTAGHRRARLVWRNLNEADRDTIVAFLRARMDADPVEAFRDQGADAGNALGDRVWVPVNGTLTTEETQVDVFTVTVDCIEAANAGGVLPGLPGGGA